MFDEGRWQGQEKLGKKNLKLGQIRKVVPQNRNIWIGK